MGQREALRVCMSSEEGAKKVLGPKKVGETQKNRVFAKKSGRGGCHQSGEESKKKSEERAGEKRRKRGVGGKRENVSQEWEKRGGDNDFKKREQKKGREKGLKSRVQPTQGKVLDL